MRSLQLWNVKIIEASQALLENPININPVYNYHKYFPLHMEAIPWKWKRLLFSGIYVKNIIYFFKYSYLYL